MGRGLVKQDGIILNLPCKFVTVPARNVPMRPFKREICAGLMIEQGRFPSRGIVAILTAWILTAQGKLVGMNILVTPPALLGCGVVNHILHGDFKVRWLVTIDAGHCPVGAREDERSGRMVEAQFLRPGHSGVAGFTTPHRPIGASHFHPLCKFAPVRIHMTGSAG